MLSCMHALIQMSLGHMLNIVLTPTCVRGDMGTESESDSDDSDGEGEESDSTLADDPEEASADPV